MSTVYRIPVTPHSQQFKTSLGGVTYTLDLNWSSLNAAWVIDISSDKGVPILSGLVVVAGTDLLAPFKHLNFGGALLAINSGDITQIPTFDTLGKGNNLYFVVP